MKLFEKFKKRKKKCNRLFEKTICEFRSGNVISLESSSIPLQIYTSPTCGSICENSFNRVKEMNKELNNIFEIELHDITKTNIPDGFLKLPFIKIGNKNLYTNTFTSDDLIEAALEFGKKSF